MLPVPPPSAWESALGIMPNEARPRSVELPDVGKHGIGPRNVAQSVQHGLATGGDSVAKDKAWVTVQTKLEWRASFLEGSGKVLREGTGNQAPQKVADHNPSNPAAGLLKGHDAAEAATALVAASAVSDAGWDVGSTGQHTEMQRRCNRDTQNTQRHRDTPKQAEAHTDTKTHKDALTLSGIQRHTKAHKDRHGRARGSMRRGLRTAA